MSTRLPKCNSDINAWMTLNNYFNSTHEYINVVANGNEIPTVKQYSRFEFYNTDNSFTIPSAIATGNNEYEITDTPTYLINEAIYEDSADVTLTWGGTVRGVTQPSISNNTWYLYCQGSYDQSSTTIGQGTYIASTDAPTYSIIKKGWYHTTHGRAISKFTVSASTVSDIIVLGNDVLIGDSNPNAAGLNLVPGRIGQLFIDKTNSKLYYSKGTTDADDWIDTSAGTYGLTSYYDTGWIENLINGGINPDWTNVHLGDDGTQDSNVNHALNCGLEKLQIIILISTDGTDGNSFEVTINHNENSAGASFGITPYYVDANNIKLQTGSGGVSYVNDSGSGVGLTTQAYYYRIVVVKLY